MRQILKYVISILFIGAVFGGAWWYFDRASRQPAEQVLVNRARPAEETAVPVQTEPVARGPLVLSVATSGQAYTRRQITVKAEVSGKVTTVDIREGAPVEAGAPAVNLDDTEYRIKAANAKADFKKALTKHRASVIEGKRLLQELENQKKII